MLLELQKGKGSDKPKKKPGKYQSKLAMSRKIQNVPNYDDKN